MNGFIDRLKEWWESADRTQKLVTGFGAAFLVVLLGTTVMFASQPKMQPVFPGMTDLEKGQVYDELTKKGFKAEISPSGDVTVAEKDLQRAKMALATAGKLPKGGSPSALAAGSFMDAPNVEASKLRSQLESELASSIATLNGVSAASVHIAPGKDSPVLDEKIAPTAVVNVTEASDGALTQEEGKSIANLVQYSVTGMTGAGVKVVTGAGKTIYDGAEANSDAALANNKMEAEQSEAHRRQSKLQTELDQILGRGNAIVDVDVTLNMDPTSQEVDKVLPSDKPLKIETGDEKMGAGGAAPSGVAGLEANVPGQPAASPNGAAGDSGKYSSKVKSEEFATTTTHTKTEKAMGDVTSMNITVTANKKELTADKANAVEERVNAALGANAGQPGFTSQVIQVEFANSLADTEKKAQSDAAAGQRMQQIISLLPMAALFIVGFMLIKAIGKTVVVRQPVAALAGGSTASLPGTYRLDANHPSGSMVYHPDGSASLPDGTPVTAEMVKMQALAEADAEELEKQREALRALGIDDGDQSVDVRAIRAKLDIPLEQIKKMADNKPEVFAMLLKSWILEDRK